MSPHEVACPTCDAEPGALCRTDDGRSVNVAHVDRIIAASTESFAQAGRMKAPSRFPWRRS